MLKVRFSIYNSIHAIFIIKLMAAFKFKLYHWHFLFFFFILQGSLLASLYHPRSIYHFNQWNNFYQSMDLYLNNFLNSLDKFIQQMEHFQRSFFYIKPSNYISIYRFNHCSHSQAYLLYQLDWGNPRNHCKNLTK